MILDSRPNTEYMAAAKLYWPDLLLPVSQRDISEVPTVVAANSQGVSLNTSTSRRHALLGAGLVFTTGGAFTTAFVATSLHIGRSDWAMASGIVGGLLFTVLAIIVAAATSPATPSIRLWRFDQTTSTLTHANSAQSNLLPPVRIIEIRQVRWMRQGANNWFAVHQLQAHVAHADKQSWSLVCASFKDRTPEGKALATALAVPFHQIGLSEGASPTPAEWERFCSR